jgi:hypothetical protein
MVSLMLTLVEDFLQYLRHERGQSAGNKRRDAEAAENRRDGTNRLLWERGIYAASLHERTEASDEIGCAIRFGR